MLTVLVAGCDPESFGGSDAELDQLVLDEEFEAISPEFRGDQQGPDLFDEIESYSDGGVAISGTHKVCSYYVPSKWRDTLVVPDGWVATDCYDFADDMGAYYKQIGCLTNGSYEMGPATSGVPHEPGNVNCW